MFHQIRLRPEDRPLLRFLWCDLKREDPPDVYEWQVLLFGTTCSPCCAIYGTWRLRHQAVGQQHPVVVHQLPHEAKSDSTKHWLSHDEIQPTEGTLGLSWHFESDTLGYKHRPVVYNDLTMRNVYEVLATQYDPIGYIIPYTTRAKVLLQQLWMKKREWDDPIHPGELRQAWIEWENELPDLAKIQYPRWYEASVPCAIRQGQLHIFCDASERAYGSVA